MNGKHQNNIIVLRIQVPNKYKILLYHLICKYQLLGYYVWLKKFNFPEGIMGM